MFSMTNYEVSMVTGDNPKEKNTAGNTLPISVFAGTFSQVIRRAVYHCWQQNNFVVRSLYRGLFSFYARFKFINCSR